MRARSGKQARADGAEIVVAWGGDGTINEVGSAIVFSEVALGIVPGGSGNGLARDLGIPLHAERALEIAASGRRRRIDAGQIDTALFFNVACIGLDALIARHIAHPEAQRGLSGYARVTFVELPRYRARHYEIECAGRCRAERALIIALANSRQDGNGALIAPGRAARRWPARSRGGEGAAAVAHSRQAAAPVSRHPVGRARFDDGIDDRSDHSQRRSDRLSRRRRTGAGRVNGRGTRASRRALGYCL